jgi:hypothetical protein
MAAAALTLRRSSLAGMVKNQEFETLDFSGRT